MMLTVNDIQTQFKKLHMKTGLKDMLVIRGTCFIASQPAIFGTPNREYIQKEIKWYESQSLNIWDMDNPPATWKYVADKDGYINSNYGWCIFSKKNGEQYKRVLEELKANPSSRRGTMIYISPDMHQKATINGRQDFMCTMGVHYSVRTDIRTLNAVVQMRSNDAIYGYKNDYAWQEYVLRKLAQDLGLLPGNIIWQVADLHIYPKHRYLVHEAL